MTAQTRSPHPPSRTGNSQVGIATIGLHLPSLALAMEDLLDEHGLDRALVERRAEGSTG